MRGQVHWVQQAEAVQHPDYLLSPRLDGVPEVPVKPWPGEWTVLGQGRHGRDRRRDINTRVGQSIRDAVA